MKILTVIKNQINSNFIILLQTRHQSEPISEHIDQSEPISEHIDQSEPISEHIDEYFKKYFFSSGLDNKTYNEIEKDIGLPMVHSLKLLKSMLLLQILSRCLPIKAYK